MSDQSDSPRPDHSRASLFIFKDTVYGKAFLVDDNSYKFDPELLQYEAFSTADLIEKISSYAVNNSSFSADILKMMALFVVRGPNPHAIDKCKTSQLKEDVKKVLAQYHVEQVVKDRLTITLSRIANCYPAHYIFAMIMCWAERSQTLKEASINQVFWSSAAGLPAILPENLAVASKSHRLNFSLNLSRIILEYMRQNKNVRPPMSEMVQSSIIDASIRSTFWTRSRYMDLLVQLGVITANGELSNAQLPPALGAEEITRIKAAFWKVPMDRSAEGAGTGDGGGRGGGGGPGGGLRVFGKDIFFDLTPP